MLDNRRLISYFMRETYNAVLIKVILLELEVNLNECVFQR